MIGCHTDQTDCFTLYLWMVVDQVRRGGDENVVRYAAPAEEEEELELEENQPLSEVAFQLENFNFLATKIFFLLLWSPSSLDITLFFYDKKCILSTGCLPA